MIKHACSSDKCKAHSFLSILSKISPFSVKKKMKEKYCPSCVWPEHNPSNILKVIHQSL